MKTDAVCMFLLAAVPLLGQAPVISANGVVNGASFRPGISSGSFLSISGANLAATTRTWRDSDFSGNKLPLSLDGVSVKVNGRSAAIAYISPRQINALAPADTALGTVQVTVTTPAGTSAPVATTLQTYSPAFFLFEPENRKYVAAVYPDGVYVGKDGVFGGGVRSVPAAPRSIILVYGTGFGPTAPPAPADEIIRSAAPLANPSSLTIRIGGVSANVQFAGISGAGLYQFNVEVPDVPDGDQAIVAEISGLATQPNVFITLRRPPPAPKLTQVTPNDLVWGQQASLRLEGEALTGVTGVEISPPDGIAVTGRVTTSSAATAFAAVTVAANAPIGERSLAVVGPGGRSNPVPLTVRQGNPQITTIVPNPMYPDRVYWDPFGSAKTLGNFEIKGTDLAGVQTVEFSPPDGLRLPPPTTSSTTLGGILTTDAGAPLGTRTVRAISPGGASNSLMFQVQAPPAGTPVISEVTLSASNSGRSGSYSGKFNFIDSDGDILTQAEGPSAKLLLRPLIPDFFALLSCSYSPVTGTYLNRPGETSGTIQFSFSNSVSYRFSGSFFIYVSLIDAAGHESNTIVVRVTSWVC